MDILGWQEFVGRVVDDAATLGDRVRRALRRIARPASRSEAEPQPDEHRRLWFAIFVWLPISLGVWAVILWALLR